MRDVWSLTYQKNTLRFLGLSKPDNELVALAQRGDLEAFDELVSLHQDRVFALAYRMLGNADDAGDIQQDTFVRAWRSLRKFRGNAAFPTWLHRITVNLCISQKRRRADVQMEPGWEAELTRADEPSAVACLEKAEAAVVVGKVLAALPAHYRVLVVLREMEERPFEEIAEILGCSIQSARVRASKARKLLRERMRPYLAEDVE